MSPTTLLTKPTTTRPPEPDSTMTPPPAEHAPYTWTITTVEGITLTGHQPDWSMDNPSDTGMTLDQTVNYLRGYAHYTMLPVDPVLPPATIDIDINGTPFCESTSVMFAAQIACHPYAPQPHERVPTGSLTIVDAWDFEGLTPTDLARFAAQIACHPYAPQPHERVPTGSLTIVDAWDFEGLTPTDLARFATQIRTQADYFENTVLPELTTAREDWTSRHSTASVSSPSKVKLP